MSLDHYTFEYQCGCLMFLLCFRFKKTQSNSLRYNYGGLLFYFLLSSTSIKSCFTNCIVSVMIWKYRMNCKSISNFFAYHLLITCIMLPKLACYFLIFFFPFLFSYTIVPLVRIILWK